jgi:hypothetical protein
MVDSSVLLDVLTDDVVWGEWFRYGYSPGGGDSSSSSSPSPTSDVTLVFAPRTSNSVRTCLAFWNRRLVPTSIDFGQSLDAADSTSEPTAPLGSQ